jgi:6-phosphogluconolactonase
VFAIEELQSTISTWAWEPDGGHLTPRGRVTTLPSEWSGTNGSAEIAIHPNGHVLYGSNRGHDSLAIFDVATDGTVTLVGHERTGGRTPRFFTLTPGGQWLVAANQDSDDLTVFRVDETTGALTRSGPTTTVGSPVCLVFVPPAP